MPMIIGAAGALYINPNYNCAPAAPGRGMATDWWAARLTPSAFELVLSHFSNCATLHFLEGCGGIKGSTKVIEELNKALREELTAINQYFLHAEMCENWGYEKLSEYIKKQSIGEMKHAEALMERILFLDGSPSMKPLELAVGRNVQEMLQSDLTLELGAVKEYNAAIQVAVAEKDNGSRDLFVTLLKDEEDHVDWLEAQLHMIKELGYERYLTMQMGEDEEE